jgi:hypothetical protein
MTDQYFSNICNIGSANQSITQVRLLAHYNDINKRSINLHVTPSEF